MNKNEVDQQVIYCSNVSVNSVLVSLKQEITDNINYKTELIRLQRENTELSNKLAILQKENESLRPPVKTEKEPTI